MPNKLKDSFNRMMEQAKEWDSSDLSEARKSRRYENLISFIEEKILPYTGKDVGFKGDVFKALGYLYDMTLNQKKASESFEKALKIYSRTKDKKGLAETHILAGDMHRDYGRSRQALQNYEKAIEASKNTPELSDLEAESLSGIGDLHRTRSNYKEALTHLKKAKTIYRKNKNVVGESEVLWTEGYTYIYMSRYDKAEKAFRQMIQWYEQGKVDETHRDTATGALADIYRLTGRYEESLKLYSEAEETMDIEGYETQRAWILAMMGHTHLQLNKLQDAKRSILKAENLSRKTNNDICLVWALQAKAELEKLDGKTEEAIKIYKESNRIAKKYGMRLEIAHSHLGLAGLTAKKGTSLYEKALRIYKDIGSPWGIKECNLRKRKQTDRPLNFP